MSVVNPDQLKQYFQSGNVPTQGNFADLIDSTFNRFTGLIYAGSLNQPLHGTVTTTSNSKAVSGTGTQFQSDLWPGAAIQIGTQIYTVNTIPSNTQLTLNQTVATGSTNVSAFTEGTLFSAENYNSEVIATLTPRGYFGIGTATPTVALEVAGTVMAAAFSGSGAALTDLSMDNIAGNIAASRITGTLQAAQLPAITAGNITGTLALNQIPDLSTRTVLFYAATPCLASGGQVTLNWLADPSYDLVLSYVSDTGIVSTSFKTTAPSNTGTTNITISQTTMFTLTASVSGTVIAQHQVQISVASSAPVVTPLAYVTALKAKGVLLQNIIAQCAAKFNYDTLNVTNVGAIAQVMKDAGFLAKDIYQNVEQYYDFKASDPTSIPYMEELIKILGTP